MLRPSVWPLLVSAVIAVVVGVSNGRCGVVALQFLSSADAAEMINGEMHTVPKRQVQCTQADYDVQSSFQIQSETGAAHQVVVRCNRVTREYDLHYYAKIPRTGRLMTSTISVSRNSGRFLNANVSDAAEIPSEVPFAARKLLHATITGCSWQDDSINGDFQESRCETTGFFSYPGVAIILKVKTTGGSIVPTNLDPVDGFGLGGGPPRVHLGGGGSSVDCTTMGSDYHDCPSIARVPGWAELAASECVGKSVQFVNLTDNGDVATNVPCYNGPTRQQFDVLVNSTADMTKVFAQFGNSFKKDVTATANVFGNVTLASGYFNSYAAEMNQTSWSLHIEQTREMDMANLISDAVRQTLANHSLAIDRIANNLGLVAQSLATEANRTNDALDKLLSRSAAHHNAEAQILQGVLDAIDGDMDIEFRQLRASQKGIMDFITLMQRSVNKEDTLDAQAKQVQDGLDNPLVYTSNFNTRMYPFTENTGVKGVDNENDLGPTLSTIVVTNDTFRYPLIMEGGTLYGVVTTMVRRCGTSFMVNAAPFNPTWRDILTLDGPGGCSTNFTGYEPAWIRCRCWNEVLEERCPLSGPSAIADWIVTGAESDGCLSGYRGFPGGNNNTTPALTATDLGQAFATIAQRGPPAYGSAYFARDRTGLMSYLPYSTGLRNVSNFIAMINNPIPGEVNLAAWYAQVIELAYQEVYNNLDQLRVILKGTVAHGMTQTERLFTRYKEGDAQSSTTFTLMWYEPYFLTVSTLMLVSVEGSIDVTIDGGTTTRVTDVTIGNARENLLRHDKMNAIVFDPTRLLLEQYDVPPRAVSFSPHPGGARATLMYPAVADEAQFTHDQFEAIRGGTFKHPWGDHVASWYINALDSNTSSVSYGQCLEDLMPSTGDWCLRRKHFKFSYTGPFDDFNNPGKFVLGDIDSTLTGEIELPSGQVSLTVSSVCPEVTQFATIGEDLLIELVNTQPEPNQFQIIETGACPDSRVETLDPGQHFTVRATKCAFAPSDTPDILSFAYKNTAGNWIPCPTTIPLVYSARTNDQFVGAGLLGAVHALASRRHDVLVVGMRKAESQLFAAMQEQMTDAVRKEMSLGFHLNDDDGDSVFDDTLALQQQVRDLDRLSAQATIDSRANFTNALQLDTLHNFDAEMSVLQAEFEADFQRDVAASDALAQANARAESSLEAQEEFLTQNHNDAGDATAAFGYFGIALDNAIQADIRKNPQGKYVGVESPWAQVKDFLLDTLSGGGAFALIGLFIGGLFGWLGNIFDTSGNGTLNGLMLGLLGIVLSLTTLVIGIVLIVKLTRFFSDTDASKAESAVAQELKQTFPITSNDGV